MHTFYVQIILCSYIFDINCKKHAYPMFSCKNTTVLQIFQFAKCVKNSTNDICKKYLTRINQCLVLAMILFKWYVVNASQLFMKFLFQMYKKSIIAFFWTETWTIIFNTARNNSNCINLF